MAELLIKIVVIVTTFTYIACHIALGAIVIGFTVYAIKNIWRKLK